MVDSTIDGISTTACKDQKKELKSFETLPEKALLVIAVGSLHERSHPSLVGSVNDRPRLEQFVISHKPS